MDNKKQITAYKVHINNFDMFYEKYKNIDFKNNLKDLKKFYTLYNVKILTFLYNGIYDFDWVCCTHGGIIKHNNICENCSHIKCKVKDFKTELRIKKLKTIL